MKDPKQKHDSVWDNFIRSVWRTPIGLAGIVIIIVSLTLMLVGMVIEVSGLIHNPYFGVITYLVLPGGVVIGMLLLPLAGWLCHRKWFTSCRTNQELTINLDNSKHRKMLAGFIALSVFLFSVLIVIGYEGYHFTDSAYFCGKVCHTVMDPEYTAYQGSPHAKVACVACHIGPGAGWFVRAKISGVRQVFAVMNDSYSRPIPAPVEHLRPARDTCEQCHWPEKFHGKRVKSFTHFTNSDQKTPEVQEIALHIGGRNPITDRFEGIHWHVSNKVKVEYQPLNEKRTAIGKVRVTLPSGSMEEYAIAGQESESGETQAWRTMDCIDCHNRPTHVYDTLENRVDFGLESARLNPEIEGLREDAITVLTKQYNSRKDAEVQIPTALQELQGKRHGGEFVAAHRSDIETAAKFLVESYLKNVWPAMNVTWGTYRQHLGHQFSDDGYGCFRCHDDEHESSEGNYIRQDCDLCHDEPE